jgi:iron(II)-dependent oxidoreductase
VLRRSVARLESRKPTVEEVYFYTLAALHEDMHAENFTMNLQTDGYHRPALSLFDPAGAAPPVDPAYQPHDVNVPGGTFLLGADPEEPFVFDNEKWAHAIEVKPFRISTTPVTNAEVQAFVDDNGYRRRECWSRRGWTGAGARRRASIFWSPTTLVAGRCDSSTARCRSIHGIQFPHRLGEASVLPVGGAPPDRGEWEMAATSDFSTGRKRRFPWATSRPPRAPVSISRRCNHRCAGVAGDRPVGCRQMIGNVWEWVETPSSLIPASC